MNIPIKLKIMIRAVKIRLSYGEPIDNILSIYPKLTKEEAQIIKDNCK